MGFASPSSTASKRKANTDDRGSTKAPPCRYPENDHTIDAYRAQYETSEQPTEEYASTTTSEEDGEVASDDGLLTFDGLAPYPQSSSCVQAPTQNTASTAELNAAVEKTFSSPPKALSVSPKAATSKPVSTTAVPNSPSAPWPQGTTNAQKWATRPNKRAREIAACVTDARNSIVNEVQEPEYALRDVEISEGIEELKSLVYDLAEEYFEFEVRDATSSGEETLHLDPKFYRLFSEETVKVIACIASGGPGGVQGWHDLFVESEKRIALVMAIVGNVLVEQVFQHLFFGGAERHMGELVKLQKEYQDEDGKIP